MPDSSLPADAPSTRRPLIAVLGVHGVGDHATGDVARAMMGLIASGRESGGASGFAAHEVAVPLIPMAVGIDPWSNRTKAPDPNRGLFGERRGYFQELFKRRGELAVPADDPDAPATCDVGRIAHEYLRIQLECYDGHGEPRVHRTTRWEGQHRSADGEPTADVHLYEMHYADLSRGSSSVLGFLRGIYQLLLHLPSLGRQALDAAVVERRDATWRWIQVMHTWSVRFLTLGVPVLNGVMLLAVLALLPVIVLSPQAARAAATVVVALGAAALTLFATGRIDAIVNARRWWFPVPLVVIVVAASLTYWLIGDPTPSVVANASSERARGVLWVLAWILAIVIGLLALRGFERVRRGACVVGTWAIGTAACCASFFAGPQLAVRTPIVAVAERATLQTLLVCFVLLGACWAIIYGTAFLAFGGAIVDRVRTRARRDEPRARRCRAALRTAMLSHAVSGSGILLAVVVIWSGIFQSTMRRFDLFRCAPASALTWSSMPWWLGRALPDASRDEMRVYGVETLTRVGTEPSAPDASGVEQCPSAATQLPTVRQYVRMLLAHSTGPLLPVVLGFLAAGLLMLAWMVLPSVPLELRAPRRPPDDQTRSRRRGQWLRTGLDALPIVGWLFAFATFVLIPGGVVAARYVPALAAGLGPLTRMTVSLLDATGAFLAVSAVALVAAAAKVGNTALDVVLDVDNYLRTYPEDSTPTARIMERYTSMLRHLCAFKKDDRSYDAVIIVAHSLGTAVTADVLHLLARQAPSGGSAGVDRRRRTPAELRADVCDSRRRTTIADDSLRRLGFGKGPPNADQPPLPIHLFTMGSPLRQPMNRFFPHRFWWVREAPDGTDVANATRRAAEPSEPSGDHCPHPSALRVTSWSNAYRSGDYVGRELWLEGWYQRERDNSGDLAIGTWEDANDLSPLRATCWEACIGSGAHTRYWDDTAPDVAARLHALLDAV